MASVLIAAAASACSSGSQNAVVPSASTLFTRYKCAGTAAGCAAARVDEVRRFERAGASHAEALCLFRMTTDARQDSPPGPTVYPGAKCVGSNERFLAIFTKAFSVPTTTTSS
jgi:hypothetical protein